MSLYVTICYYMFLLFLLVTIPGVPYQGFTTGVPYQGFSVLRCYRTANSHADRQWVRHSFRHVLRGVPWATTGSDQWTCRMVIAYDQWTCRMCCDMLWSVIDSYLFLFGLVLLLSYIVAFSSFHGSGVWNYDPYQCLVESCFMLF